MSVTKLEYMDAETLVSSSKDGTMRVWSVATGAQKEELDGGRFAFSKDSSSKQTVGKYSITFKENMLLISEDQSVVAFFRAPHAISAITSSGERIGVGCNNGEVLQLRVVSLTLRDRKYVCSHFLALIFLVLSMMFDIILQAKTKPQGHTTYHTKRRACLYTVLHRPIYFEFFTHTERDRERGKL
jgi:hypothetical protein